MTTSAAAASIAFEEERLDNGLRVILSEDHLAPVVAVNLWYDVGSMHEQPGKTGLAHLFEHMMFEGSANVPKGEHFKLVEQAGGSLNASTWLHRTNYYETAPSHNLELMLWLEADRMGGLLEALTQETLDNQRDVVREERRQRIDNQPYGTWIERVQRTLFPPGHPYHHETIGSMEDLAAATLDDVRDFFRTWYAPNNAVLSVVGDFEPAQALDWVARYFGAIPRNDAVPPRPETALPLDLGSEVRQTVEDRISLERVYVALRGPAEGTPEADALAMAGEVLSSGKGSRLYTRLVREEIAQDAQVFFWPFYGVSIVAGWATARPGVPIGDVEAAFLDAVESIAKEPPAEDEMVRARAAVERQVIDSLMRVAARADWLSEHAVVFGDPAAANRRLPALLAVEPDQIRDAARAVLRPENRSVITYVPARDATA